MSPGRLVDLNADLGEGGPADRGLLEVITSASVACGLHAGDPATMVETARLAASRGVVVGAHPSYPDRDGFGRRDVVISAADLLAALVYQIGAMAAAAAAAGTGLGFVKAHGALYNRAAVDPATAETLVEAIVAIAPVTGGRPLALLCPAGSEMARRAGDGGLEVFTEAFADRAYNPDGTLAGRSTPGAVIHDPGLVARRAVLLASEGRVEAADGSFLAVRADSICVHGDTPGALELAVRVRRALEEAGLVVGPFRSP